MGIGLHAHEFNLANVILRCDNAGMDKPRSFAPIIAAVLLLLAMVYVVSYLALVEPAGIPSQGIGVANGVIVSSISHDNHYRIAHDQAEWLFWPLEQIDRRLRPGGWQTIEEDVHFPPPWSSM